MSTFGNRQVIEIIVGENDNIYQTLLEHKINITPYTKQLKVIGAKVYNNKIGFARLVSATEQIDLIICPKIIGRDKQRFTQFINLFIELKQKHPALLKQFDVKSYELEYKLIQSFSAIKEPMDLLDNNIIFILDFISKYFKNSTIYKKQTVKFKDITLQGELDIIACILDPLPTAIHQTHTRDRLDSLQAKIVLNALNLLYRDHQYLLNNQSTKVLRTLIKFLVHKFHIQTELVKADIFLTYNFSSLFTGKKARLVYGFLKILLGIQQGNDFKKKNSHLILDSFSTTEIFFEANLFYEVICYDYWMCNKIDEIAFKKRYSYRYVDHKGESIVELQADPDYIIQNQGDIIVADAKWKILNSIDAKFSADFMKLHRDSKLAGARIGWLVYPRIDPSLLERQPIKMESLGDFEVYLVQIPVELS